MDASKSNDFNKIGQGTESDMKSLLQREAELMKRLQAIAVDIRSGLDPDSEERAVQLENREVLEEIERVATMELASVRRQINEAKAVQSVD